jgi:hypothetical protein
MDTPPRAPGDLRRCPHCDRWHPLIHRDVRSTPYANEMLYWKCGNSTGYYYAGQLAARGETPLER